VEKQTVQHLNRAVALAAFLMAGLAAPACAQEAFPQRPVTLIVPYVAGGPVDIIARTLSTKLSERWGKPLVIDNRGGAGGNIGSDAVAHANPDGYTMLINTPALVINPTFLDKSSVDPQRDLAAVTNVGYVPALILVNNKSPFNTVRELVAFAKANPGKLTFGSPGSGTSLHLAGEMFKQLASVDLTHIPYKGTSQATTDLIGGQIDIQFNAMVAALPQVKAGQLKALAVTSAQRVSQLPQLPTIQEGGVPSYEFTLWYGIFAPAKTPRPMVEKISQDMVQTLKDPGVKAQLESSGFVIVASTPAEFSSAVTREAKRWADISQKMGDHK
jgi:tripartite-type tricarboxylate transporter receptor subunit TctC